MAHDALGPSICVDHPYEITVQLEDRRNPCGDEAGDTCCRSRPGPLQETSPFPSAMWEPSACNSSSGPGPAVFAGSVPSLQLEPHRFLKCRQLWRRLMQGSFGPSPRGNDEAVCLVDTVESHVL